MCATVPREGWQLDSPHSPILPCSCNVVGTRATLDVLSSEHPGQLPSQTLPYSASLQRGALEHALVPVKQRSPAAPVDMAREGSPLVGPGSVQQLGCLRMYLRTYVRMCVRIKLPRSVLHRCKVSHDTHHRCTPKA